MSLSTSTPSDSLVIPITVPDEEEEGASNGYYYDMPCTKLRGTRLYINIDPDDNDDIDDDNHAIAMSDNNIYPRRFARIRGVVIAPHFNGKLVQILVYNQNDETWTVELQHPNSDTQKYLNIREEFLVSLPHDAQIQSKETQSIGDKQILRLQTCGYYVLLALIVISCTCLLLTPFWSFSSLIFGRSDGYIYYLSYTLFCGTMCCIIWSKKLRIKNIWHECQTCSIESLICYLFYIFCCILLWGMASYFGGFFFIYLWYCSQEINSSEKRITVFDAFMRNGQNEKHDLIKRAVVVYYYALNNYESNMHKIYKTFVINSYLSYSTNKQFAMADIDRNTLKIFMTQHWCPSNINLSHNLPFVLGIAGYHFMIWFAVFYLQISDWSFIITVCNDVLLLVCLCGALMINCWVQRCRKQVYLHCLSYFNLDGIKTQHIAIINSEVENLYHDLNQRMCSIALIEELLPSPVSNIVIDFVYIQPNHLYHC